MVKPQAKILLVNPVTRSGRKVLRVERCQQKLIAPVGIWPPVTLLEASICLKQEGFQNIEIIDGEIEGLDFDGLISEVARKAPDMVVVQATTPTIEDDIAFSAGIKRENPEVSIVFIGLHATVFPEELLKSGPVDFVVLGEPEKIVAQLARCRFNGHGEMARISGLGYRNNGNVFINARGLARDDYDYEVLPDRTLLKNFKYVMPLAARPFGVIKVSRGCDFSCLFCTSSLYYGKGWKARSPENIVEEIKDVKTRFGIDTFLFLADTFNGNNEFVKRLCSLIIENELDIKWVANSRVDLVSDDAAMLMRKAGCILVSLGIESYGEEVLRKNNKGLDSRAIARGINIFRKHGILTYGYFIFGLEGETKSSMFCTAVKAALSKLDFAVFYSLTPYPGTPYFQRFDNLDWKDYFHGSSNIAGYKGLSRQSIKIAKYLAQVVFYLKPARLFLLAKYILKGRLC
jgi:radical SAM superfamily enzyme YgiQ (UPF0313 family)